MGVTYSPIGPVNTYFSYSEGSRAPTSVELGCANPDQPGVRSGSESKLGWSAGCVARGNENNLHLPDRIYYLGPGRSPGYSVVNLGARYQVYPHVQLFVQVNNLLNHHYYTAAQLRLDRIDRARNIHRAAPAGGRRSVPDSQCDVLPPGASIGAWAGIGASF